MESSNTLGEQWALLKLKLRSNSLFTAAENQILLTNKDFTEARSVLFGFVNSHRPDDTKPYLNVPQEKTGSTDFVLIRDYKAEGTGPDILNDRHLRGCIITVKEDYKVEKYPQENEKVTGIYYISANKVDKYGVPLIYCIDKTQFNNLQAIDADPKSIKGRVAMSNTLARSVELVNSSWEISFELYELSNQSEHFIVRNIQNEVYTSERIVSVWRKGSGSRERLDDKPKNRQSTFKMSPSSVPL